MATGFILDLGAEITCPHGGRAVQVTPHSRVLVSGEPALLMDAGFHIAGCPFEVSTPDGAAPQPCVRVLWSVPAARVLVSGRPVIVSTSAGSCVSAELLSQGPPMRTNVQSRVIVQ